MSGLSEVETHDSLPFTVDTSAAPAMDPTKIVAPSIEQVDEDPEVLRSLRGEGRYFGVSDGEPGSAGSVREALPKCNNCSQRGHLKRNCPHVICTYCGSMDDHYSQHCPKAIRCANCNERGHYRSQCPKKWKKVYCTICDSNRHARDRCPSIWRVYMLRNDIDQTRKTKSGLSLDMAKVYCYNCGNRGHFGDDCGERRSSRVPNDDGSAFAGENLSSVLKDEYFDKMQDGYSRNSGRQSLYDDYANQRSHNNNNSQFDYNDYEYDDDMYDERPQKKRAKKQRGDNYNNGRQNSYNNNNGRQNSYNNNNVIQPTRRGNGVQGGRNNNSNNNNYNQRSHPLDFPRNNSSHNIDNARYAQNYNGNGNGNGNGNYGGNGNRKKYNSYQPFRSGVMRR